MLMPKRSFVSVPYYVHAVVSIALRSFTYSCAGSLRKNGYTQTGTKLQYLIKYCQSKKHSQSSRFRLQA